MTVVVGEGEAVYIKLPLRTVSLANQREHWRKRHRRTKAERQAAFLATPKLTPPCVVTLTRIAPRALDDDNLRGAFKAIRDGVADRLGVNDADPAVSWRYDQRRGKPKEYAVVVEIAAKPTTT